MAIYTLDDLLCVSLFKPDPFRRKKSQLKFSFGYASQYASYFQVNWRQKFSQVLFRLTHGYLTSMVFILVPEKLKNQKLSNSDISNGNYILFMVYSIGLVAGSGAAFGVKYIVTRSL